MENRKILVIGGAGYIGSHFTRLAAEKGFMPTVMDNLSEGHRSAVKDADFSQAEYINVLLGHASYKVRHKLYYFPGKFSQGHVHRSPP